MATHRLYPSSTSAGLLCVDDVWAFSFTTSRLGWILLALTLVGVITLFVFLGRRGEQVENSYGLNPELDVEEEQEEHSFSMN